jgi:hypothetical protein
MLAVAVLILLVVLVAVLSWRTRDANLPVRCCNPAPWPPDDLTARPPGDAAERRAKLSAGP